MCSKDWQNIKRRGNCGFLISFCYKQHTHALGQILRKPQNQTKQETEEEQDKNMQRQKY